MRRSHEKEMMDLPGQPQELLEDDLRNLRILNRYLGGTRGALRAIASLVAEKKLDGFSLLDIGTGSGDIAQAVLQWAQRSRLEARIVGLESEPVTAATAARRSRLFPEISVVRGDGTNPPFPAGSFDFVLASQLLHHFSEEKIVALLKSWARLARKGIIVSDLARHPVAYHGVRVLTRLFTRNVMTRTDAPLSVRRAFTPAEWTELFQFAGIGAFRLDLLFPFRILAVFPLEG